MQRQEWPDSFNNQSGRQCKAGSKSPVSTSWHFLSAFIIFFKFYYDSEKDLQNKDILKDIKKGVRLKHVRTNDRSRPNLRGEYAI